MIYGDNYDLEPDSPTFKGRTADEVMTEEQVIKEIMQLRLEIKKKCQEIDELAGRINALIYLRREVVKVPKRIQKAMAEEMEAEQIREAMEDGNI